MSKARQTASAAPNFANSAPEKSDFSTQHHSSKSTHVTDVDDVEKPADFRHASTAPTSRKRRGGRPGEATFSIGRCRLLSVTEDGNVGDSMTRLRDITTSEDVRTLVDSFYDKVALRAGTYTGAPFPKHAVLPVRREHFARWLAHFVET